MLPDFRVRQRDYLLEISRAITQELDLDILLERILRISIEMVAGKAGMIAMLSNLGEWRVKASHALTPPFLKYIERILAEISSDPSDPEHFAIPEINRVLQDLTRVASLGLLTGVGLPLVARKQVVGVIFIFRGYLGVFSKNDRALLSSFADQAAIAVQNASLYQQVTLEKQRTDALVDAVADGILIISNNLKIESCNQSLARMIYLDSSDIIGKSHQDIFKWTVKPQNLTLEQAVAGGWPLTKNAHLYVEGDLSLGNQHMSLPVGITYAPLHSPDGQLLNIIASIRDITRFRQAEEMKSTFISIVSHELKTPVALIKGYAGTLRRKDASWDAEIVADSLKVIEEETDRLAALIENLLDASRLQADGFALKKSDISLTAIAQRMVDRFQTQTSKHQLILDFPAEFPVILADEARLEQVFSNLISNSIKYAPSGEIVIRGEVREEFIIICVHDQGPGIDLNDIPFIFDRFYRAPKMARNTKGAGLGLYLTRAIIEAHMGKVWVDKSTESGGRICFSLPK